MRSILALALLTLAACWNGESALHMACKTDAHCGRGQSCINDFCGGPPEGSSGLTSASTSTSTSASTESTETGDACEPPMPLLCDPTRRVVEPALSATPLAGLDLDQPVAVLAGDFVGSNRPDILVQSNYHVTLLENAAGNFQIRDTDSHDAQGVNMVAADLDGNGVSEFLLLDQLGVDVLTWNDGFSEFQDRLPLPLSADERVFSHAVADVDGDGLPDLIVSGAAAIYFVPNVGGMLEPTQMTSLAGQFDKPWDTLVVTAGEERRILVTASGEAAPGTSNHVVHVLSVNAGQLEEGEPFGEEFQHPWALAQGDFLGGEEMEIVVAERWLVAPTGGETEPTAVPGRLRFYTFIDGQASEIGPALEIGVGPKVLESADLDCDGKTDLVIGTSGRVGMDNGEPQVLFGSCAEQADPQDLVTLAFASGISAGSRIAVADFDDDGLIEVAIPDFGDPPEEGQRIILLDVQEAP